MFLAYVRVARRAAMAIGFLGMLMIARSSPAAFNVVLDGGDATPASIQATVDSFRAFLGDPINGNNPGPLASGRREINWDGGGATTATVTTGDLTTFQNTRGATFTTPGTGFLQTPLDAPELTAINATYASTFGFFSPQRIFTPTESNVTDVTFSLPGSGGLTPATVSGFGAVFTDVDLTGQTTIEFFDLAGNSLQTIPVPLGTVTSASLSFAGGIATAGEQIARVRITTGNSPLGPNDNPNDFLDVVAMDDFLYAEPVAIPEPAGAIPLVIGTFVTLGRSRRPRRNSAVRN